MVATLHGKRTSARNRARRRRPKVELQRAASRAPRRLRRPAWWRGSGGGRRAVEAAVVDPHRASASCTSAAAPASHGPPSSRTTTILRRGGCGIGSDHPCARPGAAARPSGVGARASARLPARRSAGTQVNRSRALVDEFAQTRSSPGSGSHGGHREPSCARPRRELRERAANSILLARVRFRSGKESGPEDQNGRAGRSVVV